MKAILLAAAGSLLWAGGRNAGRAVGSVATNPRPMAIVRESGARRRQNDSP